MPALDDAILLAAQVHLGQRDLYDQPFILHPLRVMQRMNTEAEQMVAVLHDVVEDTPTTLEDLRAAGYPEQVVAAIDALTRRKWERYEAFVERTRKNPLACRVKLADLEDNMDLRRIPEVNRAAWKRLQRYRRAWAIITTAVEE